MSDPRRPDECSTLIDLTSVEAVLTYAHQIISDTQDLLEAWRNRPPLDDVAAKPLPHQSPRTRSMGRPRLKDIVRGLPQPTSYGPRRAVVQCRHGPSWYSIAEIRGHVVLGADWPHDLKRASYDVCAARCPRCPVNLGPRLLLLPKIREALRVPHTGLRKLDAAEVTKWLEEPSRLGGVHYDS